MKAVSIGILVVVVAAAAAFAVVFSWLARRHSTIRPEAAPSPPEQRRDDRPQPDAPIGFGYKCIWFAIRAKQPTEVAGALGLQGVRPCNWAEGIPAAYAGGRNVFVSPCINGWILAVGSDLPTCDGPKFPDRLTPCLDALGKQFPEVQAFASHRIVGHHSWTRVVGGRVARAFTYVGESGEVLRDLGQPDAVEATLREQDKRDFIAKWNASEDEYMYCPDEQQVMKIAGAWSLDPTKLDEMHLPPSTGLLGQLPQR